MVRVLLCTGGSVGHLAPAVAAWRAVGAAHPGSAVHALTSDRPADAEYLRFEGIPFTTLPLPRRSLLLPLRLLQGYLAARRAIRAFKPDVLFSKGGAVSVAPALAARHLGVPVVLHESDAVSGYANRLVARWATTVCLGFGAEGVPQGASVTGNPVRPTITQGVRERGLARTGLTGTRPVLLVMGGSQGAQAINEAITRLLPQLLPLVEVIHLTGIGKGGASPRAGYCALPFATEELPDLYAAADLAVSRSGAGGIAELAANGIPSVLVPLRGLAQDHQFHNARRAREVSGCPVLDQAELDEMLVPLVREWLENPALLKERAEGMRRLHRADAAERIAQGIVAAAGGR